ncbi:MAG: NAD(P)-dependent oxidoreductase, partial [Pseudomonadota bacterium]
ADRCYFCHDAPCIAACPTAIDIPLFIRQIQTGVPEAAARTIWDANILGGMCARVCPTETLCEEACVREAAEGKPVEIGRLQRFATDTLMAEASHPFSRAPDTGKRVAVVGAGPAGLSCAHRLACHGHTVTVFDAREKPGGLNEYGIAAYKTVDNFAHKEVEWLLSIGGITITQGQSLGDDFSVSDLQSDFDAVFLGMGLAGTNALDSPGAALTHVEDAVDFISALRQSDDLGTVAVGRHVVVIGGGMTAVDAAVQAKLLGAEHVTIAYRRAQSRMNASRWEQDLATAKGVTILPNVQPTAISGEDRVEAITLEYTADSEQGLVGTGETRELQADQVLLAVGQALDGAPEALAFERGKIAVTGPGRTSLDGIWAGGDCASGGDDLTVTAVAEGRDAAEDIHAHLTAS